MRLIYKCSQNIYIEQNETIVQSSYVHKLLNADLVEYQSTPYFDENTVRISSIFFYPRKAFKS